MPNGSINSHLLLSWLKARRQYGYVLICGLAFLALSYGLGFPRIAWSDELYYIVVARNLAEHGTLNTTIYLPEAILRDGYPLRDVHMPGYMLVLSLPVLLLGHADWVMLLPSQISYLVCGLLIYWAGKRLFSPLAGYGAAVSFFMYPLFFHYANTAMSELVLTMAALLVFCIWLACLEKPSPARAALLAAGLVAGLLVRETFLVFIPAALFVIIRSPLEIRRRIVVTFLLVLCLLLAGVALPLSLHRSYYPDNFANIMALGESRLIINGFIDNFFLQISRYLTSMHEFPQDQILKLQSLLLLLVLAATLRFNKNQKAVVYYFVFAYLGILLSTSIFRSATGWRGLRILMMAVPPALIALNGAILQSPHRFRKAGLWCSQIALIGFFTWQGNSQLVRERVDFFHKELPETQRFTGLLDAYQPKMIMAEKPWGYALERFPVNVIRLMPESMDELIALQKIVPSDVIVARSPGEKDDILRTLNRDCVVPCYRLLDEMSYNNNYFIIKSGLYKQPLMADLNPDLRLLGVDTISSSQAGTRLPLTLVWQARRDVSVDYAVAVRILDAHDGEAQYWLGKPVLSSHSTNVWRKDEVVPDTWDIALNPAVAPGKYKLEVEVYDSSTKQSSGKLTLAELNVLKGSK